MCNPFGGLSAWNHLSNPARSLQIVSLDLTVDRIVRLLYIVPLFGDTCWSLLLQLGPVTTPGHHWGYQSVCRQTGMCHILSHQFSVGLDNWSCLCNDHGVVAFSDRKHLQPMDLLYVLIQWKILSSLCAILSVWRYRLLACPHTWAYYEDWSLLPDFLFLVSLVGRMLLTLSLCPAQPQQLLHLQQRPHFADFQGVIGEPKVHGENKIE